MGLFGLIEWFDSELDFESEATKKYKRDRMALEIGPEDPNNDCSPTLIADCVVPAIIGGPLILAPVTVPLVILS